MTATKLSIGKRMGETVKAGCRWLCQPILPVLPEMLTNRLPFLGRVCVRGPGNLRLRFQTYGPYGKDRIAIKLARRGFWGYEGETTRILLPLAQRARGVIDIGANTGLFALLAAQANPDARVLAFEPVPFVFDMLQQNIRLNRANNLHAVQIAVADFCGETPFFVTHTSVGIPTDSSACAGFRSDVAEIRLPTTTLDAYLAQHPLAHLDLLKIDAEATEASVIRGAQETLRNHRPFVICEVLENLDHSYVQAAFKNLAYRFYHIGPNGLAERDRLQGSLEVDARNYLFAPVEKAAEFAACNFALAG